MSKPNTDSTELDDAQHSTTQRYLTADAQLQWETMMDMLTDITDGYLSNIDGVEYHTGGGATGLFRLLGEDDSDVDPDLVGSRLLKSVSQLHSIAIEHTIEGKSEAEVLYRLAKFAPVTSKLSDKYAMSDEMYRAQWNDDVLQMCEAIRRAERAVREGPPQQHGGCQ